MLLKTKLVAAQMSINLQLHWKRIKAASLSRGKVQYAYTIRAFNWQSALVLAIIFGTLRAKIDTSIH